MSPRRALWSQLATYGTLVLVVTILVGGTVAPAVIVVVEHVRGCGG